VEDGFNGHSLGIDENCRKFNNFMVVLGSFIAGALEINHDAVVSRNRSNLGVVVFNVAFASRTVE
jgi:hypothetical protein